MRISKFQQTPFVTHSDLNLLKITVADWDYCNPYEVRVIRGGQTLFTDSVFSDRADLLIPAPKTAGSYTVVLYPFEDLPVYADFELRVPREQEIQFVYFSHEDIGYCAYANKLEYECYEDLLKAVELCEKRADFRYVIEHNWWLTAFEKYASAEDCARLQAQFDGKRIELSASPMGVHTHWAESEQLARSLYFSTRYAAQKWHTEVKTAIYCDLSGVTRSAVSAYAGQGVKYCTIFANGFRRGRGAKLPPIFRWLAPNGRDSLILWNQDGYRLGSLWSAWCDTNRQYKEGRFFFDESKALKTEKAIADFVEGLGEAAYDILPISFYDDRETPTTMLLTVCDYMNKKWKYPRFSMGLPSEILGRIEREYGERLPVIAQDITDQWGDFATISPQWTAAKRFAAHSAAAAQTVTTLNAITRGTHYDGGIFDRITRQLCLFDEHCWATSSKHPQKMHRFNLEYVKKHSAMSAAAAVSELLAAGYGKPDGDGMGIYNPLPRPRVSGLRLGADDPLPAGLLAQRLDDGSAVTEPLSLGASEGRAFETRGEAASAQELTEEYFETPFYAVKVSRATMKIVSVFDKQAQREVFNGDSEFGIGRYIYVVTEGKEDSALHYELPKRRKFSVAQGPVAFTVTTEEYEEQSGANILTSVIFYRQEKNIDFDIRFENAVGLMGDYYDRYKKNIFFSFPLKTEKTEYYTGLACGIVKESRDRAKIPPLDFSVAENWVAAEDANADYGVGLYSEDMAVFHFGEIKYNRFSGDLDFSKSNIFLYGASNRTDNLNFRTPEDCRGHYRVSLLPYSGGCADTLPVWVQEKVNAPIVGGRPRGGCEFEIHDEDGGGLRLLTFKKAEDCDSAVILRLQDEAGRAHGRVRVTLPFRPIKAAAATVNEYELGPVETDGNSVIFAVDKFSCATVKIYGDFKIDTAKTPEGPIIDLCAVEVENKRSIVCFEKSADCAAEAFDIYGDGRLLCSVENETLKIQSVELDCRPSSVEVRAR